CLSDDPLLRDGSPEAAVVARATVVAHHKKVVGRNLDRPWKGAFADAPAGGDERLVLELAVHYRVALADRDRIPRPGDPPLDEVDAGALAGGPWAGLVGRMRGATGVPVRPLRRVEHDDVTSVRFTEVVVDAADKDRSEEHTSELQSRGHLVCRLLLEKKKYANA